MINIVLEVVGEPMSDKFEIEKGQSRFITMDQYNPFNEPPPPRAEVEEELELTLYEYEQMLTLTP